MISTKSSLYAYATLFGYKRLVSLKFYLPPCACAPVKNVQSRGHDFNLYRTLGKRGYRIAAGKIAIITSVAEMAANRHDYTITFKILGIPRTPVSYVTNTCFCTIGKEAPFHGFTTFNKDQDLEVEITTRSRLPKKRKKRKSKRDGTQKN